MELSWRWGMRAARADAFFWWVSQDIEADMNEAELELSKSTGGAWSRTPIWDTSSCDHPLTVVPYLRPWPRRLSALNSRAEGTAGTAAQHRMNCGGRQPVADRDEGSNNRMRQE